MNLTSIKILNPWWDDPSAIETDEHIVQIKGKPYYFDNPIKRNLLFEQGRGYILRGGRQVGKTTLLKEKIKEAIQTARLDAKKCLFLSCESFGNFEKLQDAITNWIEPKKNHQTVVCLDEITFVEDWQRCVLWLYNAGLLKNASLFISGSNARDLKKMAERFSGRNVKEINIYPLNIDDYSGLECFKNLPKEELLKIYMKVGGFPHGIRDFCEFGQVLDDTYETYSNWIFGDAHRFKLSREVLVHILFRIFDTLGTQVTWQRVIEKTPIKSHETASDYVEHLELAFLCRVLNCYDPDKEMSSPRKAKKIYFIDPLLCVIAGCYLRGLRNCYQWWVNYLEKREKLGNIFESIVINYLAGKNDPMYYWYSSNLKRETDVLLKKGNEIFLFDIKLEPQKLRPVMGKNVNVISLRNFPGFITPPWQC
ncbi:MAG: ATP-binding protein [Deltaproteobacteria bacterium]|nr:ATP-binding protein [Deltaproteobacteria bacterium]